MIDKETVTHSQSSVINTATASFQCSQIEAGMRRPLHCLLHSCTLLPNHFVHFFLLLLLLVVSPVPSSSTLLLPSVISSNMTLQRGPQRSVIFGSATTGQSIAVQLDSEAVLSTVADASGQWSISLPPHPASLNHRLTVTGEGRVLNLSNIAFGDVYLCSGQSNMDMDLNASYTGPQSIEDSIHYPAIRLFSAAKVASFVPLHNTTNRWPDGEGWVVSQPRYLLGPAFVYYSAVCYYYGRALYHALNNDSVTVPIGLLLNAWGGTVIEAWSSVPALKECGPVKAPAFNSSAEGPLGPLNATALYNGLIVPLQQVAIKAVVWFQGESNVDDPVTYQCRFPAMIRDWRELFNNARLYFYFVLLAGYKEGGDPSWPLIRNAQMSGLSEPYVRVATAQDLGDEASLAGGIPAIHSRNKTLVGERLALLALHDVYNKEVVYEGPTVVDVQWPLPGDRVQTVILRYESRTLGSSEGLHLLDSSECDLCCNHTGGSPVVLLSSDGQQRRAAVSVIPHAYTVLGSVDVGGIEGVSVVGVRVNWEAYPQCGIYNAARLPQLPLNINRYSTAPFNMPVE